MVPGPELLFFLLFFCLLIFWLVFHFAERDSGQIIPRGWKVYPHAALGIMGRQLGARTLCNPVHVYRIYIYDGIVIVRGLRKALNLPSSIPYPVN